MYTPNKERPSKRGSEGTKETLNKDPEISESSAAKLNEHRGFASGTMFELRGFGLAGPPGHCKAAYRGFGRIVPGVHTAHAEIRNTVTCGAHTDTRLQISAL